LKPSLFEVKITQYQKVFLRIADGSCWNMLKMAVWTGLSRTIYFH